MASWRGISVLWITSALLFLACGAMLLTAGRPWMGGGLLLVGVVDAGMAVYAVRRFRRDQR